MDKEIDKIETAEKEGKRRERRQTQRGIVILVATDCNQGLLVQYPKPDGVLDIFQIADNRFIVGLVDVNNHVTNHL